MAYKNPKWLHQPTVRAYGKREDTKRKKNKFVPLDENNPEGTWIMVTPVENRRRVEHIHKQWKSPEEIYKIIQNAKPWPYKTKHLVKHKDTQIDRLLLRDKALLCLLYLTGGRNNEVLRLRKSQFNMYRSDRIVLERFVVSKRKDRTKTTYIDEIFLPRVGSQAPFTAIIEEYLKICDTDEKLFKFGTSRAWPIVKYSTGLWCHWFRSMRIREIARRVRSPLDTAKLMQIKSLDTIQYYYDTTAEDHAEALLK